MLCFYMTNTSDEININVPVAFSGQELAKLLTPQVKKEKPQSRVARVDGEEGTLVVDGVAGIHRGRNTSAGGIRRGEQDVSLVGQRPPVPESRNRNEIG